MPNVASDIPAVRPWLVGAPVIRRPFKDDGVRKPDTYARHIERSLKCVRTEFSSRLTARRTCRSGFPRTEELDHVTWSRTTITVDPTKVANPENGLLTAQTLLEAAVNAEQKLSRAYTFAVSESHVASVCAAWHGRDWLRLLANDGLQDFIGWFNLTTGEKVVERAPLIDLTTRNGGFETPAGHWVELSLGGTIVRDTVVFYSGVASCKITTDGSGNGANIRQAVLQPGMNYNLKVRIRKTSGTIVASLRDGSGNVLANIPATGNTGVFDLINRDFKATDGTIMLQVSGGVSQSMWFDEVILTPIDDPILYMEKLPEPGDAYYLLGIAFVPRAAVGSFAVNFSNDGSTISYTGDPTKGFTLYGPNLDLGITPGPYVAANVSTRSIEGPDYDHLALPLGDNPDRFALLTGETDVAPTGSILAAYQRTYSRIPAPRYVTGSKWIQRPGMHDVFSGSNWAATFDDGVSSSVFQARQTIVGAPAFVSALVNRYQINSHGAVAGDKYVMWLGNVLVDWGTILSVPDSNHVDALNTSLQVPNPATFNISRNAAARYINGSIEATTQEVTEYYGLGVSLLAFTSGTVNADTDIPLKVVEMDPKSWLAAIVAGSVWAIESTQGKQPYAGCILGYQYTRVLMADALKTITP